VNGVRIRTVDAFADKPFSGNPAGVVVLDEYPADAVLQAIASELNLSETAFAVPSAGGYRLRWFTPGTEVDLCGHATLATAHCLFADGVPSPVAFDTRSGTLTVNRSSEEYALDFPARPATECAEPPGLSAALGVTPRWVGRGGTDDVLCEVANERTVRELRPDIGALAAVEARGVIVTAAAEPGGGYDYVSRFFAPRVGVNEDPVTGSAHTVLAPYWSAKLGRDTLVGYQASRRGGRVGTRVAGDRVVLTGSAVTVLDGTIEL
jgi:PhzF family phenazine biosynthesis protein